MNIDELMTYDWVLYNGKPIRIEEISRPAQKVSLCNAHQAIMTDVKNIEPIMLTPEVLMSNEFKTETYKDDVWYECHIDIKEDIWVRTIVIAVEFYESGPYLTVFDPNGPGLTKCEGKVQYVHKLQNIMRSFTSLMVIENVKQEDL